MPEKIHCRVKGCRKSFRVKDFADAMHKLREHRKSEHPKLFRESIKKGIATRKSNKR